MSATNVEKEKRRNCEEISEKQEARSEKGTARKAGR